MKSQQLKGLQTREVEDCIIWTSVKGTKLSHTSSNVWKLIRLLTTSRFTRTSSSTSNAHISIHHLLTVSACSSTTAFHFFTTNASLNLEALIWKSSFSLSTYCRLLEYPSSFTYPSNSSPKFSSIPSRRLSLRDLRLLIYPN